MLEILQPEIDNTVSVSDNSDNKSGFSIGLKGIQIVESFLQFIKGEISLIWFCPRFIFLRFSR